RRAPARACAYRALTAAPDTQLAAAAARAAGIGAAALRALVAAGLAERVMRARAPAALPAAAPRPALTPAQRTAADAIAQAVAGGPQTCFLLHGITGSGKTEVFLAAAAATLAAGREVVLLPRLAGAVAVLASATPSAESYQAALDGRHRLLTLPERPTAHPLPVVEVVDLRARADDRKRSRLVSEELRRALEANLAAGG